MNNLFNQFLIVLLFFAANMGTLFAQNKFQISDTYVTIFSEPERINALGKMHKGEEFEAIGNDGSLLIFMYKGQKAYIASYCCKKIKDIPTEKIQRTTAEAKQPKAEIASKQESTDEVSASEPHRQKYITKSVGTSWNDTTSKDVPGWMKNFLSIMVMVGLISGIWSLFGPQSFSDFFDRLAGRGITPCSKLTHWRPAILLVVFGLASVLTNDMTLAFVAVGIYELCLILYRSKVVGNFRVAFVEALYLGAYAMGTLLFFWMLIILAFLAAGGPSGSKSDNEEDKPKDRSCDTCNWYTNPGLSADQRFCRLGFNGGCVRNCSYHQRR